MITGRTLLLAQCPFVKGFVEKHADYADLLNG